MSKININVLNQNLVGVLGTDAKQVLIETIVNEEVGPLYTFVSLAKGGTPVNFDQVFSSFKLTAENGPAPDDGPYELTGAYSVFQFGPPDGYSQPVSFSAVTEIASTISDNATEGEYIIHIEIKDAVDAILASTDIPINVVSVETALFQYEEMLQGLTNAEIAEIKVQYGQLEALRQVVNSAILSLPVEQQGVLMSRYYIAAGHQYTSFKLIALYEAKDNNLEVAKVKNVGGNAPFSIVFKDSVCIGDTSEAYLFYPEGYRAAQTNIANYPDDQADRIESALVPGQTNLVVGGNYIQGGKFAVVFKVADAWYRSTFEMNPSGDQLIVVNDIPILIPNAGDEWVSPLEAAMQNATNGTSLSMSLDSGSIDKDETAQATVTASYPVFSVDITSDVLLDTLVATNIPLAIGSTIKLSNNSIPVGTYVVDKIGVTEFFISKVFNIERFPLNAHSGNDQWEMQFSNFAPGHYDFTVKSVAAKADRFEVLSSRYTLASYTSTLVVADRRAALDAAIAGTSMQFTGDVIRSVGEPVEIAVTTTYPVFLVDLDPKLGIDMLLTLNKALPIDATIEVKADGVSIGAYTETTGLLKEFWLNDIINAAHVRPILKDRSGQSVSYTFVITGMVDNDYNLSLKATTAYQANFESVDARYTMASVEVPLVITDKSILVSKIIEAQQLLIDHQEGDQPGCAARVPRLALEGHINDVVLVRDDGDALRNIILDAIAKLSAAIIEFKSFIVKWRVNKAGLQTLIDTTEDLLATTTAGTNIGQASAEAIATFNAVYLRNINVLQIVPDFVDYFDANTFNVYQAQIDAAKVELDAAIAVFQDARISDEDYAISKVTEYEVAAKAFYDSIRKKIRI